MAGQAEVTDVEKQQFNEPTKPQTKAAEKTTFFAKWKWHLFSGFLLVIILVGGGIWLASRPENIAVVGTEQEESIPTIVKVALFDNLEASENAAIILESTESLVEPDTTFYYVRFQDFMPDEAMEDLTLILTASSAPSVLDDFSDPTTSYVIENLTAVEFPYRLELDDETFSVEDINGAILIGGDVEIASASFEASMVMGASDSQSLPVLTSSLSGNYRIGGTIRIAYATELEGGELKMVPRLEFDIPNINGAPGPFLYLSKRPYSESRRGGLDPEDIYIPIDESGGSFSVMGRFDQILDEVDVGDIEEYANGSFVVWCRPFNVRIGGGSISTES